jgi:hypothetical protein
MEVPELRRTDFGWLRRNLAIHNSDHPDFNEAMQLVTVRHQAETAEQRRRERAAKAAGLEIQ